jgi:3-phosphoglycerate kinase
LAQLGDIYVHDAPLASLTTSNTQSEIKCQKKVMGQKMTEEMRNIAQFFMKIYPLDIDSIYHNMPDRSLEYFTFRSTAIIGGVAKTTQEILDKILLANSFLDTFEQIFLVGEIGLAAISALGIHPGCVERSTSNVEEYETMKEFFIKLFNKSIIKGCQIKLPVDFIVATKLPLEQLIQEHGSKVRSSANPNQDGN